MKTLTAILMIGLGVGAVAWTIAIKYPDADIVVSGRQLFNFVDVSELRKPSSAEVPKEAALKSQPAVAQVREPQRASQQQSASSAQSIRSDLKPSAFEPWIKVRSSTSPQPQVIGETNFPDGTKLALTLTRPNIQCAESQQIVVRDGKFHTVGICDAGQGLAPGKYNVVVVNVLLQPPNVVAALGNRGEYMTGQWVQADDGSGLNLFTFRGSIEVANRTPPASRPAKTGRNLVQIARAGEFTQRLATDTKDYDPATQAARRAADDPYPDASTYRLIESVRLGNELEWERAFSIDMQRAFGSAVVPENVPFEYLPTSRTIPDGFRIVQILANAVLRAGLPCKSIYTVDSIGKSEGVRGWVLSCEQGQHHYGIALVGKDWKLSIIR